MKPLYVFLIVLVSRGWVSAAHAMPRPFSEPTSADQVQDLVDTLKYDTLEQMRGAHLESAHLKTQPWTDNYWPYYAGLIAIRYLDPNFPNNTKEFSVHSKFLQDTIGKVDPSIMSPAEKYDLLVGDSDFTLSWAMLSMSQRIANANGGEVPSWMGLCYGWSGASLSLPRPEHSVKVLAADGKTWVEFLPSDIKALATLLYDQGTTRKKMIGWRCELKDPPTDSSGRTISASCLDTNPATWHLAAVNQIGVAQRGFVMDAYYNKEVWNHPVIGYSYTYFNPKTNLPAKTIEEARVDRADYTDDKFAIHRSPRCASIVGVDMEVTYVYEDYPSRLATDDASKDNLKKEHFIYDLELDPSGQIVGGEWHVNQHPDFLWIPVKGMHAVSIGDSLISPGSDWPSPKQAMPTGWAVAAKVTSAYAQPLAQVVETLFRWARE